jgi:hypothetical protein
MRLREIENVDEAGDPQMAALNAQQKDLKVRKARLRANKAQAALRKAQQT